MVVVQIAVCLLGVDAAEYANGFTCHYSYILYPDTYRKSNQQKQLTLKIIDRLPIDNKEYNSYTNISDHTVTNIIQAE